ncbi:hypothetical protein GLOTRDRAFT_137657 [Gloeophyllum trabeum ATCC 11539]|uniref:E3 ubiquitin protein ligase n=1 Tax=Gloeophyllum trabeum (strain ATCC 11539 / FP-39264 / Madison 617) TaxID=670483 RepID=S7QBG9_GLOTA|nr:uncharacterized protein GLOTRDRAFT_137657 [Gloeophyllum trabeum ATCC 11539]EPQ57301.1 hypothetical protein GLOTRDRAFT_137657 [Gloeophyllum trabeum ATCC 11539]
MESRKRTHAEDADPVVTKKRAVSNGYGSPTRVNGVATEVDEPKENDELESFRKEAIFRRMKHYSREHERSQHRIEELERRRNACEAGLSAIQACWTQLIDTIRLLVKPEALSSASVDTTGLFDMSTHVDSESSPELEKALQEQMNATRELVASFVQMGSQTRAALSADDMYITCQKARTECTALRSEVQVMRARLEDAESEKENYHSRLVAAENRLERLSSRTIPQSDSRSSAPPEKHTPKEEPVANAPSPTKVKVEDVQMKDESDGQPPTAQHGEASSPTEDTMPNGTGRPSAEEMDDWREIAAMREKEIRRLEEEITALREEQLALAVDQKVPSDETLQKMPLWKAVYQEFSHATWQRSDLEEQLKKAQEEVSELRVKLAEEAEKGNAQVAKIQQEYSNVIAKRDADLVRLREQRDQQAAELSERKHKDSERVAALESEVKRLRTRMAASTGDEDLVAFLFSDESVHGKTYVDELRTRLEEAETKLSALQESLSSLNQEHPDVAQHVQSEAEAREQVAQLSKELEKYRSIYGDASSGSSSDSPGQLREKEEELQKLRLQLKQQTQAESALYTEVEKLSAAWEALDKQVKNKVFDLSALEEKLSRALADRAKIENKFYAAMRDKEAVEFERKSLVRNIEKNGKSMESVIAAEKNLLAQVKLLEGEQAESRKIVQKYGPEIHRLTDQLKDYELKLEAEKTKAAQCKTELKQILDKHYTQQAELRRREEAIRRKEKEVERLQATAQSKLRSLSSQGGAKGKEHEREEELQGEVDKLMSVLKCSTCRQNMRNAVITKCMHSFCKQCVEARISTRQRKCPACNLPFGQQDVQPLYFQ